MYIFILLIPSEKLTKDLEFEQQEKQRLVDAFRTMERDVKEFK
jgi:hypothetical protein